MPKYNYILKTKKQREEINLLDYKEKLDTIFKDYFEDDLTQVIITKNRYTLYLKNEFTNASKRKLGKVIASQSGLKEYVKEYLYNKEQERSGQLFIEDTSRQI